jgi:hypothetical protein
MHSPPVSPACFTQVWGARSRIALSSTFAMELPPCTTAVLPCSVAELPVDLTSMAPADCTVMVVLD